MFWAVVPGTDVAGKAAPSLQAGESLILYVATPRGAQTERTLLMYSAAFIWEPGEYDDDFHRLNGIIDQLAKSMNSFLGADSWVSPDGKRRNTTYYWQSLEALQEFSCHPAHLEAKRQYARWYNGYHIVISEVVRSYGDGAFAHPTPADNRPA